MRKKARNGGAMSMSAETAARIFHDWADHEGFLSEGPSAAAISSDEEFSQITPITEVGKEILRSKQIQSIAFSESDHAILVFLKRAAPKSKMQLSRLPKSVEDIDVIYRQGNALPIVPLPPQPFGSPPYTIRQTASGSHISSPVNFLSIAQSPPC